MYTILVWMRTNANLSLPQKQLESLLCTPIHFVNMLITTKLNAIKHLPDKESMIETVWKNSAILLLLSMKIKRIQKLIISTHGFHRKNNWMTFLDKLNTCSPTNLSTLPIYLFQMLLLELISKEKDYKPFWTPAYKELSEKLLLPIEIVSVDSGSNSLNSSLKKVEGKLPFLTTTEIKVQNKNSLKTYFQLSTSTVANKWEKEVTKPNLLKSLKIKLKINRNQKNIFDEWLHTSNFVYNKTVKCIQDGDQINFMSLRDKLVTANTKKNNTEYKTSDDNMNNIRIQKKNLVKLLTNKKITIKEQQTVRDQVEILEKNLQEEKDNLKEIKKVLKSSKNEGIQEWELNTPKEIRAGSVNDVCKAYKTGFTNLRLGNIKHFRLGFRKKRENNKCLVLPSNYIKNREGKLSIAPTFLKENACISMGKKTIKKHKDLVIEHDCRLVKQNNEYWLIVPIPFVIQEKTKPVNYCGIDPGVKTFMTVFGNQGCMEYKHNEEILKKLDDKIKNMKDKRIIKRKRVLKRKIRKTEKRKENLINELHWKTISNLLKTNDFIFYGDIKSHDIVRKGKNRTLNTSMNNLKFYKFKERLLFKAIERGKRVFETKEQYTTQTCSFCGNVYKPGLSRVYHCSKCRKIIGRDVNAAKNILMKGIVKNIL